MAKSPPSGLDRLTFTPEWEWNKPTKFIRWFVPRAFISLFAFYFHGFAVALALAAIWIWSNQWEESAKPKFVRPSIKRE